jgi:TonB family protein
MPILQATGSELKDAKMLQLKSGAEFGTRPAGRANRQQLRLLIALSLLLLALAVVLVKNREFWFGSDETIESEVVYPEGGTKIESPSAAARTGKMVVAPTAAAKTRFNPKTSSERAPASSLKSAATPDSPVVVTNRAVLPPLDIEVVAGDTHRTVHAGSSIAKVEILGAANRVSTAITASMESPATNAAERERLSPAGVSELRQSIDATYPLLGQHMNVQGSVVLQAVVGTDGSIEDLRVLSGPAILTAAAQQAVRQWRFKPYLQNGQPVETKARITVNFSIRISDNPATTS